MQLTNNFYSQDDTETSHADAPEVINISSDSEKFSPKEDTAGHPKSPVLSLSCLLRFPFYFEKATAHLQAPDPKLRLLRTSGRLTQLPGFPETSCGGTFKPVYLNSITLQSSV